MEKKNNYKAFLQQKRKEKQIGKTTSQKRLCTHNIAFKEKKRKEALYLRSFLVKSHSILGKLRKEEYVRVKSPIPPKEMNELRAIMQ